MKKLTALLAAAVVAACLFAGCGGNAESKMMSDAGQAVTDAVSDAGQAVTDAVSDAGKLAGDARGVIDEAAGGMTGNGAVTDGDGIIGNEQEEHNKKSGSENKKASTAPSDTLM